MLTSPTETTGLAAPTMMAGRTRAHVRTTAAAAARTYEGPNVRRACTSERPCEPTLERLADQEDLVNGNKEKTATHVDTGDGSKRQKTHTAEGSRVTTVAISSTAALTAESHDSLPLTGGPKLTHDSHTTAADMHPKPHEHTIDPSHTSHATLARGPTGPKRIHSPPRPERPPSLAPVPRPH